jgi:hypothetical protein
MFSTSISRANPAARVEGSDFFLSVTLDALRWLVLEW